MLVNAMLGSEFAAVINKNMRGMEIEEFKNKSCNCLFSCTHAYIVRDFSTGKPTLNLFGVAEEIYGDFSDGINGFKLGEPIYKKYLYDFNLEELHTLLDNGLFDEDFEAPFVLNDLKYVLPLSVDGKKVSFEDKDVSLFFVDEVFTRERINSKRIGYSLAEYFVKEKEDVKVIRYNNEKAVEYNKEDILQFGDVDKTPVRDNFDFTKEENYEDIFEEYPNITGYDSEALDEDVTQTSEYAERINELIYGSLEEDEHSIEDEHIKNAELEISEILKGLTPEEKKEVEEQVGEIREQVEGIKEELEDIMKEIEEEEEEEKRETEQVIEEIEEELNNKEEEDCLEF